MGVESWRGQEPKRRSSRSPCKAIAPTFEGWAAQYHDVVFVKVDVDSADELAGKYDVTAMPTFKVSSASARGCVGNPPLHFRSPPSAVPQGRGGG